MSHPEKLGIIVVFKLIACTHVCIDNTHLGNLECSYHFQEERQRHEILQVNHNSVKFVYNLRSGNMHEIIGHGCTSASHLL